jgi:hypothetical protein
MFALLKNHYRTLFGIRKKRKVARHGPKPAVGTIIYRGSLQMSVNADMTKEQWLWLTLSGWRTLNFAKDRRRYTALPEDALSQLLQANPQEREARHAQLIRRN